MWWKTFVRRLMPRPAARMFQRWRLDRVMAKHTRRVVRHEYGSGELSVELADPLAVGWYDRHWPQPPEFRLLCGSRLRPGATVFDLGAHQGVVALMLAREVGPTGRVVAVEALAHNAAVATRNRDLNGMPWVEIVCAAVAGREGTVIINRSLNAQVAAVSDYAGTVEVPAVTIDALAARYGVPEVVYLDIEGMELDALHGATAVLVRRPDFFVEVHTGQGLEAAGGSVSEVLAHVPDSDFERYVHSEGLAAPVPLALAPPALLADRFFLTALGRRPPTARVDQRPTSAFPSVPT
jgi:FkbM family methyltransferase